MFPFLAKIFELVLQTCINEGVSDLRREAAAQGGIDSIYGADLHRDERFQTLDDRLFCALIEFAGADDACIDRTCFGIEQFLEFFGNRSEQGCSTFTHEQVDELERVARNVLCKN